MIEGYAEHLVGRRREIQRWVPALRAGLASPYRSVQAHSVRALGIMPPSSNPSKVVGAIAMTAILLGLALLIVTTAIYILGRNRIRTSADGFSSAPGGG